MWGRGIFLRRISLPKGSSCECPLYMGIKFTVVAKVQVYTWYNGPSLDPRPSDLCILMEGLVRDDHVA